MLLECLYNSKYIFERRRYLLVAHPVAPYA